MLPRFSTTTLSLWLVTVAAGCAHNPEPKSAGRLPLPPGAGSSWSAPSEVVPELSQKPAPEGPRGESPSVPSTTDAITFAAPPGARSLPKLELKNVGLHVGGGPNDAATHHAFAAPIGLVFGEFQRCYRSVELPRPLAIYGVDLVVEPGSGRAKVRTVRTKLGGKAFLECLQSVLEAVHFQNPLKKPTSVSYSLRFALSGLEADSPKR